MNNNNNIEIESFCRYQIEIKTYQAPKQAPLPILSMLSNNGNKIYIEFDIATNHLGLDHCENIFKNYQLFGTNAICTWSIQII